MKLFKRENHKEAVVLPIDAYVCFGKNENWQSEINGWYILFNLTFITENIKNWINPDSFETRAQDCYLRIKITRRKPRYSDTKTFIMTAWSPIKRESA